MKETGELLKNRRVEKNYSLEEISSQTKIQLSILKSLEEGRIEDLKNKTYTKGFLRQYARALQLNPEDVIAVFDKETAVAAPVVEPVKMKVEEPIQEKTNVLWFRAPSKMITFAGIIVISTLAAAIYFLSVKMASYSEETFKEPTQEEETAGNDEPAATETAPAAAPETKTEAAAATEPAKTDAAAVAPAATDTVKPATETATAAPATDKAATTAAPADKAPATTPATPSTATDAAAKPAAVEPAPAPAKAKRVVLVATENITVEATWSSGKTEKITLKPKSKHTFLYPKKITLTISNGGGVKVTSNEEELGAPGEAGQPVTLSFD